MAARGSHLAWGCCPAVWAVGDSGGFSRPPAAATTVGLSLELPRATSAATSSELSATGSSSTGGACLPRRLRGRAARELIARPEPPKAPDTLCGQSGPAPRSGPGQDGKQETPSPWSRERVIVLFSSGRAVVSSRPERGWTRAWLSPPVCRLCLWVSHVPTRFSRRTEQGAGCEVEQPGLEPASLCRGRTSARARAPCHPAARTARQLSDQCGVFFGCTQNVATANGRSALAVGPAPSRRPSQSAPSPPWRLDYTSRQAAGPRVRTSGGAMAARPAPRSG